MTCLITRPQPQALFDHLSNLFSASVLGGAPVVPESNEWYVTSLNYAMMEEIYATMDQQMRERDPRWACCENLTAMAAKNGVFPRSAVAAVGYAVITGDVDALLPSTIEILANGQTYRSTGTVPARLVSGQATIQIRALQPGPGGNSNGSAQSGTITTPIAGVDSAVTICGGRFCDGEDAETCEAFRTRYIARMAYKPRATAAWIHEKLLTWPCVTRVCAREGSCCSCDEGEDGCGCLGCGDKLQFYVLFDNTFPCGIPPDNIVQDINLWMFGERPGYGQGQVDVGVCGSVHTPIAHLVNLNIDINGCPTPAQQSQIKEDVSDLFTTICPSTVLLARQVELIVANILGADVAVFARFESVNPDTTQAVITQCGDVEPACDYLPCLNELTFTGPQDTQSGC